MIPKRQVLILKPRTFARAFTIIELMISIAVIFILITTAAVALKSAKKAANRTESMNALRQMMQGYSNYYGEHKGMLLPGYIDPATIGTAANQLNIKAKLDGGYALNAADTASFVWRLAPYLNHDWKIYMVDYRSAELESRFTQEYEGNTPSPNDGAYGPGSIGAAQWGIGRLPSFGLNSTMVGGDNVHTDDDDSPWSELPNPNPLSVAATRMAQVNNPAKLIVFGATTQQGVLSSAELDGMVGPGDSEGRRSMEPGYVELRPPYLKVTKNSNEPIPDTRQWFVDSGTGQIQLDGFGGFGGLPIDRVGDDKLPRVPIGHLDGSVESEYLDRLSVDMSRWSPFALSTK